MTSPLSRTVLPTGARLAGVPEVRDRVEDLLELAPRGLAAAYPVVGGGFAQTVRRATPGDPAVLPEGDSLRYAAIAALGLDRLPVMQQRETLRGLTANDVVDQVAGRAATSTDPGAVALAAWAAAEVAGRHDGVLFARLAASLDSGAPLDTVAVAWMLTAAVAAVPLAAHSADARASVRLARVVVETTSRLLEAQGPGGTYPHRLHTRGRGGWRGHVGSFADQVYPLQALARASAVNGEARLLAAANRTAAQICDAQGDAGQWWWWYDARTGQVVERFPVYSVHQHAMAPMVLHDLVEHGGDDHRGAVAAGVRWIDEHPETDEDLVDEPRGVVWRKVGRREPRKTARALNAATTTVRPGLHLPGIDRMMPPGTVDHECRPYELGWLLYAWLPAREEARR